MKRVEKKSCLKQLTAAVVLGAITASFAHGGGANWVIKRDDKIDSPIFKQRPMIAHEEMAPAAEQSYIAERYVAALQDYQSKIRRQWPNAEVSSTTRWVSYSDDLKTKRVVDFKSNLMEISLENLYKNGQNDIGAVRQAASEQVAALLSTHVSEAQQQDPIAMALNDVFDERGAERGDATDDPLIFVELFNTAEPDAQTIADTTDRLMKTARIRFQALSASADDAAVFDKRRVTYLVSLPRNRLQLKARQYQALVQRYAKKAGIPTDGVMAMMHSESYFNPLARSHVPAFGLMQVVPSTIGRQAAAALFDNPRLFSPAYLSDAEKNIEVGTTYLGQLYNEQTASIKNPQSRWYFVQAIYKIGAAEAARLFDANANPDKAMASINALQPPQVLQRLTRQEAASPLREYFAQVQQNQALY